MGKLIKFPAHRVVHNNPKSPDLTEEEARQIKEDKFVEQITESLILDIIHVLQENVVDTKTDIFLRDLSIVIESIKSLTFVFNDSISSSLVLISRSFC